MNYRLSTLLVCFIAFWLAACGAETMATDAPALFPTGTPAPVDQMAYPPDTRTGIATVDDVIDAVHMDDRHALIDLVHYTVTACTNADGLGGPPKCGEGQVEGTPVEVFPVMGPGEGSYTDRQMIDQVFPEEPLSLFAVFQVADSAYREEYWPAGSYGVILRIDGEPVPALTLRIDDGGIVRLDHSFGEPFWLSPSLLEREVEAFILPPATDLER
jgi:hypothetical protein